MSGQRDCVADYTASVDQLSKIIDDFPDGSNGCPGTIDHSDDGCLTILVATPGTRSLTCDVVC